MNKARFKLPRELYLSGLCKGNGMTLGLTNGTDNGGLMQGQSSSITRMLGALNAYGENVGPNTTISSTLGNANIGITTNSLKSGIIVERNNSKYLCFYIN